MSTFQNPGDSRVQFAEDVPAEVKRFIWCTSPHKCWAEYLAGQRFKSAHIVRKYDGWFLVVYVDHDGTVRWQTTSGFVHSVLIREVEPLIEHMKALVASGRLLPTHAFKLEIVVTNNEQEDFLHLIGKNIDPSFYYSMIVVTDFLQPYSAAMTADLDRRIDAQHANARKHKTAPLSAQGWLNSFRAHQGDVMARLQEAREVLIEMPIIGFADSANAGSISGTSMLLRVSKLLTQHAVEGCVVHCTDEAGNYVIYKLKLEYLGGLGSFYSPAIDRECTPDQLASGRQFVVRCLTAECFHGTHIPLNVGVGYYDDDLCTWVVSDCIRFKYTDGPRVGRYLEVSAHGKHIGVTRHVQHIANMIAKILDIASPTSDLSNLHLSSRFKKESTKNLLNVSELGILIGGSANHVYESDSGNYHLQAAVLKCMGMAASSHEFRLSEIRDIEAFATHVPVMHSTPEWSKGDWARMVDLKGEFNRSNVLSTGATDCTLACRVGEIRLLRYVPRPIFSELKNLAGVRCCAYNANPHTSFIVRTAGGVCTLFSEIRGTKQVDIVFVGSGFHQLEAITQKIKGPFLMVRDSWALKCKANDFRLPDISFYTIGSSIKDEKRFLWKRARQYMT